MLAPSGDEIGSGPTGETCGTCQYHYQRTFRYIKCLLAYQNNRGSSTDVGKNWPACFQWSAEWGRAEKLLPEFNAAHGSSFKPQSETDWLVVADYFQEIGREGDFLACVKESKRASLDDLPF